MESGARVHQTEMHEPISSQSLEEYLRRHIGGFAGLRALRKFASGQSNPTYLVVADSGQYVLRRKPAGPLLTEQQYLESYCKRLEIPAPPASAWRFYLAVSLFRLASICQGVYRRGLLGNASSPVALELGARTALIMASAVEIAAG